MAPLTSRLFKLKVGYRLGTIRPKTMSLALLAEQTNEEKDSLGPSELTMSSVCAPIPGIPTRAEDAIGAACVDCAARGGNCDVEPQLTLRVSRRGAARSARDGASSQRELYFRAARERGWPESLDAQSRISRARTHSQHKHGLCCRPIAVVGIPARSLGLRQRASGLEQCQSRHTHIYTYTHIHIYTYAYTHIQYCIHTCSAK